MVIRVLTPSSYFFLAFPFFASPSLQLTSKNICLLCKPASELHVKPQHSAMSKVLHLRPVSKRGRELRLHGHTVCFLYMRASMFTRDSHMKNQRCVQSGSRIRLCFSQEIRLLFSQLQWGRKITGHQAQKHMSTVLIMLQCTVPRQRNALS